ncbi:SRR1-domain-containing protein [Irpex lacteus]|nr:SRR1-domain-containing protein [Irpex lacteus]
MPRSKTCPNMAGVSKIGIDSPSKSLLSDIHRHLPHGPCTRSRILSRNPRENKPDRLASFRMIDDVFEYEPPFTPSRPRKKRKNKNTQERRNLPEALERTRQELLSEAGFTIAQSPKVLCLGLGSPASSRDARAQLAFLLEVCDDLKLERSNVSAYDPAFTDEDDQLLASLNMKRLPDSENRDAAYPLSEPTIAYMPHCDLHLYENILGANWSSSQLPQLVLIANRFSEYLDSTCAIKKGKDGMQSHRVIGH